MKLPLVPLVFSLGCLDPQVADERAPSGDLLPAGASVPSIDEDIVAAAALAAGDGVPGLVPRISAFAAGEPIHLWDFGPAPALAAPLYVLAARAGDGSLTPVPHPPIVAAIPGDASYSPYRVVFVLVVTPRYAGERITSVAAIEDAVATGLVEPPFADGTAFNDPIVASDVRLDVGGGHTVPPTGTMYYEHTSVTYFDAGPIATYDVLHVPIASRYVLRREGHESLSEPVRGIDIDGDGDALDTNDIVEQAAADPFRSPLCRTVDVVVADSIASIDTSSDETVADLKSATQLFAPAPVTGVVVAYEPTDELRNCAAQRISGEL